MIDPKRLAEIEEDFLDRLATLESILPDVADQEHAAMLTAEHDAVKMVCDLLSAYKEAVADNAALVRHIEDYVVVGVPDELTIEAMRQHQIEANTASTKLLDDPHRGADILQMLHKYRMDKQFGPDRETLLARHAEELARKDGEIKQVGDYCEALNTRMLEAEANLARTREVLRADWISMLAAGAGKHNRICRCKGTWGGPIGKWTPEERVQENHNPVTLNGTPGKCPAAPGDT